MKFKAGDKARIVGNEIDHRFLNGEIVTVTPYKFKFADYTAVNKRGENWYVKESDLEPILPVQEEETFDKWYSRLIEWQSTHFKETTTKYEDFRWIEENVISNLRKEIEELKKQK